MFEAQLLNAGSEVFSPWFPRGGDNLKATLDVIEWDATGGAVTLTVDVYTKSSETPGNGAIADNSGPPPGSQIKVLSSDTPATGRFSDVWPVGLTPGINELVRYKFKVDNGDSVLFRMLPAVWFDSVNP